MSRAALEQYNKERPSLIEDVQAKSIVEPISPGGRIAEESVYQVCIHDSFHSSSKLQLINKRRLSPHHWPAVREQVAWRKHCQIA
jgi:hypothetical protein